MPPGMVPGGGNQLFSPAPDRGQTGEKGSLPARAGVIQMIGPDQANHKGREASLRRKPELSPVIHMTRSYAASTGLTRSAMPAAAKRWPWNIWRKRTTTGAI